MNITTEALILGSLIAGAGLLGMVIGFFIGTQYGRLTGELRAIKSLKSRRSHSSSRNSERPTTPDR